MVFPALQSTVLCTTTLFALYVINPAQFRDGLSEEASGYKCFCVLRIIWVGKNLCHWFWTRNTSCFISAPNCAFLLKSNRSENEAGETPDLSQCDTTLHWPLGCKMKCSTQKGSENLSMLSVEEFSTWQVESIFQQHADNLDFAWDITSVQLYLDFISSIFSLQIETNGFYFPPLKDGDHCAFK